jgi:tRNA(adenine34) deaminase
MTNIKSDSQIIIQTNIRQNTQEKHEAWMDRAIALAIEAGAANEVPVGAIVINSKGEIIGTGQNRKERDSDPTAHAEILAIRAASQSLKDWYLKDCLLYVTLEPCPMCAGAILQSRIHTLIYGASDPKTGAIRSGINLPDSSVSFHRLQVIEGIRSLECQSILQNWFKQLRQSKAASIQSANRLDRQ